MTDCDWTNNLVIWMHSRQQDIINVWSAVIQPSKGARKSKKKKIRKFPLWWPVWEVQHISSQRFFSRNHFFPLKFSPPIQVLYFFWWTPQCIISYFSICGKRMRQWKYKLYKEKNGLDIFKYTVYGQGTIKIQIYTNCTNRMCQEKKWEVVKKRVEFLYPGERSQC